MKFTTMKVTLVTIAVVSGLLLTTPSFADPKAGSFADQCVQQAAEALAGPIRSLQFPNSNVCKLTGKQASADAVRTAIDEIASQGGANAIRFVSITADGSVVVVFVERIEDLPSEIPFIVPSPNAGTIHAEDPIIVGVGVNRLADLVVPDRVDDFPGHIACCDVGFRLLQYLRVASVILSIGQELGSSC